MSKLYYDHLLDLEKVERKINKIAKSRQEREEIHKLVDDIVHHRIMGCVLDKLDSKHHEEFLSEFSRRPHDTGLIGYLGERIKEDVEGFIRHEIHLLTDELLAIIHDKTFSAKLK